MNDPCEWCGRDVAEDEQHMVTLTNECNASSEEVQGCMVRMPSGSDALDLLFVKQFIAKRAH